MKKALFAGIISLLCLAGCSSSDTEDPTTPTEDPSTPSETPTTPKDAAVDVQMTESALGQADIPVQSAEEAEKMGKNINKFAFDFARKVDASDSFVISPYSIHSALSMAAFGTNGDSYDEMKNVLNLSGDRKKSAEQNGALSLNLRYDGQQETAKFDIANRIWTDSTLSIVPEFSEGMNAYYRAPLQIVDFVGHSSEVREIINEWVSNVTAKMIQNLIPEGALTEATRMVLVNAIHFDGKWKYSFAKENTISEKFKRLDKSEADVDMMHQTTSLNYYESSDNDYKAIVMPYKGEFEMLFILPNKDDGITTLMTNLKENDIEHIKKDSKVSETSIALPKFKIETSLPETEVVLKSLGMNKVFTGEADFSNMASNADLFISKVIHKAVIDVDEEGTKAAAATAVIIEKNGFVEDLKVFKADHPFAFALIHSKSNAVLFTGQYLGK